MNPFIVEPSLCKITYSCIMSSGAGPDICAFEDDASNQAIFSSETGDYEFQATDLVGHPPGLYFLTIKGTVGSKIALIKLEVMLIDPCLDFQITMSDSPFTDSSYEVGNPQQSQPWVDKELFTVDTE